MDGGREEILRPRVRHDTDGEVRLATYEAASSPRNLFDQIVASVAQGLPVRGVERVTGKAVSKSAASRMWAEKSREQLELLRSRPLNDVDWLCVLIDGVWLTHGDQARESRENSLYPMTFRACTPYLVVESCPDASQS